MSKDDDQFDAETIKMPAISAEDAQTRPSQQAFDAAQPSDTQPSDTQTTKLDSGQFRDIGSTTSKLDSRDLAAITDDTARLSSDLLRGLDDATDDTAILDPAHVLETLQVDGASMHQVTSMQTAVHSMSAATTPIRYIDPEAPRPSIMVLPDGWEAERMEKWLNALQGALIQFGSHGFERLVRDEIDSLRQRFGAEEDDFWGEGKRSRLMREYLAIHARAGDDTTVAEIAASNASMLGPYMRGFADSVALSNWDVFEVVQIDGASIVLERLYDQRRVIVNASLDNYDYETSDRVVSRVVEFRDIAVATSNIPLGQGDADAVLGSLRSFFKGRSWRAFMRNEGAVHLMRLLYERLPVRHVTPVSDRYDGCSRDDVVELHRLFTELEVGIQEEGDLSRGVDAMGAAGYAESFDGGLRFILMADDQTWVVRRLNSERLHVVDIRYMESLGLRPRIHGMVTPNQSIGPQQIRQAAAVARALVS